MKGYLKPVLKGKMDDASNVITNCLPSYPQNLIIPRLLSPKDYVKIQESYILCHRFFISVKGSLRQNYKATPFNS